jgi:hypothetical protein
MFAGCMPAVIAPPPAPPQLVPPIALLRAPPGKTQVLFNADSPSLVEEVTGHYEGYTTGGHGVDGLTFATVCPSTPCAANFEAGNHPLRFTSLADPNASGDAAITVGAQPTAFNYNLGHNVPAKMGWIAPATLALTAGIVGITFTAIGQPDAGDPLGAGPNFRPIGEGLLIGTAALTVLAIYLGMDSGGSTQNGTGTQWTLGPPTMSAPGAMQ